MRNQISNHGHLKEENLSVDQPPKCLQSLQPRDPTHAPSENLFHQSLPPARIKISKNITQTFSWEQQRFGSTLPITGGTQFPSHDRDEKFWNRSPAALQVSTSRVKFLNSSRVLKDNLPCETSYLNPPFQPIENETVLFSNYTRGPKVEISSSKRYQSGASLLFSNVKTQSPKVLGGGYIDGVESRQCAGGMSKMAYLEEFVKHSTELKEAISDNEGEPESLTISCSSRV
ncbi:expressed protein [Phakopsora pachyrhizi]|uniref:Expressed protein n=1 Tax=Phakopsora pachyrhizi TaxID=170000 RepID=A0AAV0BNA8_PHAPC|nr:expressed protein [Phakopsora pachyrhizi]